MVPQVQPDKKSSWKTRLQRSRFAILLAALLGTMVYASISELITPRFHSFATRLLLGIVFGWLTISAVYAVSSRRSARIVALILGVPFLITEVLDVNLMRDDTQVASHILCVLFFGRRDSPAGLPTTLLLSLSIGGRPLSSVGFLRRNAAWS